jgi:hypothetical protein
MAIPAAAEITAAAFASMRNGLPHHVHTTQAAAPGSERQGERLEQLERSRGARQCRSTRDATAVDSVKAGDFLNNIRQGETRCPPRVIVDQSRTRTHTRGIPPWRLSSMGGQNWAGASLPASEFAHGRRRSVRGSGCSREVRSRRASSSFLTNSVVRGKRDRSRPADDCEFAPHVRHSQSAGATSRRKPPPAFQSRAPSCFLPSFVR